MKNIAIKDLLFVSIQLLLFAIYFLPIFTLTFDLNLLVRYVGLFLSIAGITVIILAILQLNKNLTPFPTPIENSTLIQTGLYKYVRHPIYSGIILTTTGFGIYIGGYRQILIGLLLWVLFYYKSKYEENLLLGRFSEYEAYRKNTFRFFPFL